jgi:hypothetical protein
MHTPNSFLGKFQFRIDTELMNTAGGNAKVEDTEKV